MILGQTDLLGQLQKVLAELNRAGGFAVSVLADLQGLTIASATAEGGKAEAQAAAVALVQKTVAQAREQLAMASTDEITLLDAGGRRLVCRLFGADNRRMILAVMVPQKHLPYRRLTNAAVRSLHQILQDVWE